MSIAQSEPRIVGLQVNEELIVAQLADGRSVSVPLAWSWRLSDSAPEQRKRFEIIGDGEEVHWPNHDEDISARALLTGLPAGWHDPPKRAAIGDRALSLIVTVSSGCSQR